MGRKSLVAVLVVLVAVAVAVAVAPASLGGASGGGTKQPRLSPSAAASGGVGDDDANLMRKLQRDQLARAPR